MKSKKNLKKILIYFLVFIVLPIISWIIFSIIGHIISITGNTKKENTFLTTFLNPLLIIFSILGTYVLIFIFFWTKSSWAYTKNQYISKNQKNENDLLKISTLEQIHDSKSGGFSINHKLINKKINFNLLEQHHFLVIGTSGIGKTQNIVLPNIISNIFSKEKPNLIITDPKGEIFDELKEYIAYTNYQVNNLDFINFSGTKWNPFFYLNVLWHTNKLNEFEIELDKLIEVLINNIKSEKDPIWHESSKILIKAHVSFLLLCNESLHINPQMLLTSFNCGLKKLMIKYKSALYNIQQDEEKINIFKKYCNLFLDDNNKMLPSIYLITITTLQKFSSSAFFKMSKKNEINLLNNKSNNRPQITFIKTDSINSNFWELSTLFISSYISFLQKNNNRKSLFILDEFANIPEIKNFSNIISISRGNNIFFMLILQSYDQLAKKYKEANNILSNINYSIFMHTNDMDTAAKFSRKLGNKNEFEVGSFDKELNNISYRKIKKSKINEFDLTKLPKNTIILKSSHHEFIKLILLPYHEWKKNII